VQAGSNEESETLHQNIDVGDSNIDNLVLRPTSGVEMRGRLTFEGSKMDGERISVSLRPWDDDGGVSFSPAWAEAKEDGTFTLKNVQAGRYRVQCFKQGAYIKAARDQSRQGGRSGRAELGARHHSGCAAFARDHVERERAAGDGFGEERRWEAAFGSFCRSDSR
jgi:hypothetical protein